MSLPKDLLDSLANAPGFHRAAFEAVHASGEQVTSIRLNPAKNFLPDKKREEIPWCPQAYYLPERPSFTLDPLFHAGAYYVQEASSMFLWEALKQSTGQAAGQKVLDLCAAPGGKSTLLASYFTNGLVVANEVIKTRAPVLVENMTKWGSEQVVVTNNDPAHFQSLPGYFDVIVADAPCSGSGLFRRDPGAMEEWSMDNVQLCSQRQQRIVSDILPALKTGGWLIYSTCSYSMEEDEQIMDWLVEEMEMESHALQIPAAWGIVETRTAKAGATGYRFYPDQLKGEGFFIAVFQKKNSTDKGRLKETAIQRVSRQADTLIRSFAHLPENHLLFQQQENIRAIPAEWLHALQVLASHLYIKKAGIEIGSIKGKDIIPSHELAMSNLWKQAFEPLALSKEQALQYLRRKEMVLPDAPLGWQLVSFESLPLGWVKILPNRVNNYYPTAWRILKE
jgi:16S rRNA C967 or C1407 C5-methylase (RsmB/RsmF family)/NOL1/NOP2/fmu family ribosome biogenesis protein